MPLFVAREKWDMVNGLKKLFLFLLWELHKVVVMVDNTDLED